MEQGLVTFNGLTTIKSASVTTDGSTFEEQQIDDNTSPAVVPGSSDDVMDLLRAIEMSRLQSVRENEQNIYRPNMNSNHSSTINTNDKIEYFNDLQQAIELSLRTKGEQELLHETTGLF
jgi:hypothetical protein